MMEKRFTNNPVYTLKRAKRKSLGITIDRDGTILVHAPLQASEDKIEAFICEKQIWIQQKLRNKEIFDKVKVRREFVDGQGFLYLGRSYRLRYVKNKNIEDVEHTCNGDILKLRQGYFELNECQRPNARRHFINWYKKKTEEKLLQRIQRYENRIGLRVERFGVANLGHRWASFSRKGKISFNWRCVMAPIWVFDYILIHEMAHMIEKPHSKKFWQIIERVMPDFKEQERWLRENGQDLDL